MIQQPVKKFTIQKVSDYFMSEKLDGVRAELKNGQLFTKTGNLIPAPQWFLNALPKHASLDGELWEERGHFDITVGRVLSGKHWENIKFMIIDIDDDHLFYERYELLRKQNFYNDHIQLITQHICNGKRDLNAFHKKIIKKGGEGVCLHHRDAEINKSANDHFLKFKIPKCVEVKIIGLNLNNNRSLKSLRCQYNDKQFSVGKGLNFRLKSNPPKVGTEITIEFLKLTPKGVPFSAVFVAIRDGRY